MNFFEKNCMMSLARLKNGCKLNCVLMTEPGGTGVPPRREGHPSKAKKAVFDEKVCFFSK
jgi:hypothetical protein